MSTIYWYILEAIADEYERHIITGIDVHEADSSSFVSYPMKGHVFCITDPLRGELRQSATSAEELKCIFIVNPNMPFNKKSSFRWLS